MSSNSIAECLRNTIAQFDEAKIDTAILDAEVLLSHFLGIERADLYLKKTQVMTDDELERFSCIKKRRIQREPVAYILGHKEFWSLKIRVTHDVLIPRPETEGIVEAALKIFKKSPHTPLFLRQRRIRLWRKRGGLHTTGGRAGGIFDILDLCTGSGCVAAALAAEFPNAKLVLTDISGSALEVARQNLEFAAPRVKFVLSDLFDKVDGKFNLITANPPYATDGEFNNLALEIRRFEPRCALLAGQDGLAVSKKIIKNAAGYLVPGGALIMEMGMGQAEALRKFAEDAVQYKNIEIIKDYSGINRIMVLWTNS